MAEENRLLLNEKQLEKINKIIFQKDDYQQLKQKIEEIKRMDK